MRATFLAHPVLTDPINLLIVGEVYLNLKAPVSVSVVFSTFLLLLHIGLSVFEFSTYQIFIFEAALRISLQFHYITDFRRRLPATTLCPILFLLCQ
jgi:hypothetical protein